MTLVVRRKPASPVAVVVSYHCTVNEALADTPIASIEHSPAPVKDQPSTLRRARVMVGAAPDAPVALVGFSRGCQAVRSLLSENPAAVVTIDGTHSSWPVSEQHIEWWRELAAKARRGNALWVATCTRQTYTERLHDKPFASTVTVLERAIGVPLRLAGMVVHTDGSLLVESHPSQEMDGKAHEHQAQVVLPRLVRDQLVPYLLRITGHPSERETDPPDTVPLWRDPRNNLGERCLAWLGRQFGLDPRERLGPVHDDIILSYSKHARRGGRFVGVTQSGAPIWDGGTPLPAPSDEWAWCAYLQGEALRNSLLAGETPPHGIRASVAELVADARAAGTLRNGRYTPIPGDLAIEARGGGDPLKGGSGHVRRVVQLLDGDRYLGLGGNEDNRIRVAAHPLQHDGWRAWIAVSS